MKELIEYMAKALVDNEEEVRIEEIEKDDVIYLKLYVAKDDIGKVIGRQGRIAKAMRTILKSSSIGLKKKYVLDII